MTDAIRPFRIDVDDLDLADLRARIGATRWPGSATVEGWAQGVPLDHLRDLCGYWAEHYDWAATQARLNRLPHFTTTVDDLDIHFVHVRSARHDAIPVILTHGWPGSFLEFEGTLDALTRPTGPDGERGPAFHVVLASLPGYGFSAKPTGPGWGIHRIARAWIELMTRLGYERFMAAGSDWGTSVSTCIAIHDPDRLLGLHLVPPLVAPDRDGLDLTDPERAALTELDERSRTGSGYSVVHASRPQTIGYSLLDSPVGLCAWIVEKLWTWADHDGDLDQVLSRDQVLDNVTLYWLTGTAASSARLYWESIAEVSEWFTTATGDTIPVPTGCSVFPKEVPRPSRRWARRRFTDIVSWDEPERGGHFAAWEQPGLFVDGLRGTARNLPAGRRSAIRPTTNDGREPQEVRS